MNDRPPLLTRLRRWTTALLVVVWLGAFAGTHVPAYGLPSLSIGDKSAHLIGYAVLAAVFLLTLRAHDVPPARRAILALLILAAYGVFDELTQPIIGRTAEFFDWLGDVGGTVIAIVLWELGRVVSRRRSQVKNRDSHLFPLT
jgi:VanZ family protein